MMAAIYSSVLYGEDFIEESLASILPYVDLAFVVMMQRPWGHTEGVLYKDEWVSWPSRFDCTRERIAAMYDSRVVIVESDKFSPWNRWHHALVEVQRAGADPDEVVFLDPDCVFSDRDAKAVFSEWTVRSEWVWAAPLQIELWRTPAYRIRRPRTMMSFHRGDLSRLRSPDPPDGTSRAVPTTHGFNSGAVHNLGFCVSEKTMRWKHLTSLAFSPVIGESLPEPTWFEEKWLKWNPTTNNKDLDVSVGCAAGIPCAIPYNVLNLPESIKKRYDAGEWPRW